MKKTSLVGIRRLTSAAIICMATTALAQVERSEARVDAALAGLASQDLDTRDRALSALLAQSGIKIGSPSPMRATMSNLLRTYPQQAERIRTTLIAALERQGADYVRLIQAGQPFSQDAESWMFLTDAVAGLQDPRATKGLVLALGVGSIDGLADICPSAVDAIIERIHQPDLYLAGVAVGDRRQAVTALGWCLQRPAMMRASPHVLAKIRRELLADLNDPDWSVRDHAADALSALRTDPEVRAKLQANPYFASEFSTLSSDAFSFYVTRASDTRVCRIQQASQALVEEQFIGPESIDNLNPRMCSHYDRTGQDPSLCWKVEPANACWQ
jgi:HEAT repeat protein